jgi:multiple sugar transport system permease protein
LDQEEKTLNESSETEEYVGTFDVPYKEEPEIVAESEPAEEMPAEIENEPETEAPAESESELAEEAETEAETEVPETEDKSTETTIKYKHTSKLYVRFRKGLKFLRKAVLFTVAAICALIFIMPTVLTITNSFMSKEEIASNYGKIFATTEKGGKVFIGEQVNLKLIPDMVVFDQYKTVLFQSPDYLFKFWNSVIYVIPIVLLQIAISLLASYAFTRLKGRLKSIVFFIYIIVCMMPYQVTLVPNFMVINWLNLINTRWAIWLPGISSPFAVYLLTKYMKRIPTAIVEAAKVDGATEWQIFRKIYLPLCKGAIFSVAMLIFIDYWNMVEQVLILITDDNLYPLSLFLSRINSAEVGLAFAVATIYMIPNLLLFIYGEDYLVEGITFQGGVKG